jgi:hypothetical protein
VGASGEYTQQATREASSSIQILKDQRVSLCNSFNTCKMTVNEFRREQQRIDDTFTVLASISERLSSMSSEEAQAVLAQIRGIRNNDNGGVAAAVPQPAVLPAPAPPEAESSAQEDALIAGWQPGRFMFQAVSRVVSAAHEIEQRSQFGFDKDHACVLGAFVSAGGHESMTQSFVGGRSYVLVGGGEDNAKDVDIAIIDGQGQVVASDTEDDAMPLVKFVPPSDGSYEMRLGLATAQSDGAFVAMAVMHEGGYSIPAARLSEAFKRATAYGAKASERLPPGLIFHHQGDWAFFGTVLEQGQQSSFRGIDVSGTASLVLAAGDTSAENLDLEVTDSEGTSMASDMDADAYPAVQLSPHSGYAVTVQNKASRGPSLAALLILDRQ